MTKRREGYGNYIVSTYNRFDFEEYKKIFAEYFVEYKAVVRKSSSGRRIIYILKAFNEPDYLVKEIRQKISQVRIPETVVRRV